MKVFFLALPQDLDGGLGPRGGVGHQAGQFIHFVDGVAVEFDDDVTPLNAGLCRRRVGIDLGHQGSLGFGHAEGLGQFRGDDLHLDADHAPDHLALFLQLRDHHLGHVAGDGEADALAAGHDGGIDAHHFALEVEQGAAAVAGVDGGVGLEEVIIGAGADDPALGADNPLGDGVAQTEGITHRHDPVAHPHGVGITQLQEGQVRGRIGDLDQGQVGLGIPALDGGLVIPCRR